MDEPPSFAHLWSQSVPELLTIWGWFEEAEATLEKVSPEIHQEVADSVQTSKVNEKKGLYLESPP